MSNGTTQAQQEALRKAWAELDAQFDDILIVCSNRADHKAPATDLPVFYKGGWLMARSLADYAKEKAQMARGERREPEKRGRNQ